MTDNIHDTDEIIDRTAKGIGATILDDESVQRITDRVWERLAGGQAAAPFGDCGDFQREIPAFLAGTLPEGRALLVDDHTRHCVPCRRVLLQHRGELAPTAEPQRTAASPVARRFVLRAAAALLIVAAGAVGVRLVSDLAADRRLRATVATVEGSLQMVSHDGGTLAEGSSLRSRQAVRTARDSGAFIRLADGSMVEMNERTEIALHASSRGTTIGLQRGNIIVHAAKQRDGRLFVATADCLVAVKGTIFSVNHGLKGSRVSVLEGEVEVREGTVNALLKPGDQLTTSARLQPVPLADEIAWSRNAATHHQLLLELEGVRRVVAEAIDTEPPRTSTHLLELAPEDTLVYAAMPNITAGLAAARAAFYERLQQSPVLSQWWQSQVAAPGLETDINQLLDRLQPLGDALGAEAVVTVPASALRQGGTPLFLAELDDPVAFLAELADLVDEANAECAEAACVLLIDHPAAATAADAALLLWVEGDLFAATTHLENLRALAARLEDPAARSFVGSRLHERLAEAYAEGVSWLLGVDVARMLTEATAEMPAERVDIFGRLGLADASTLVMERHRDGEWYATDAELRFSGPRRGMASWLAAPAPMGSLEFVSPNASVVAAAVTRDTVDMFDELLALVAEEDNGALAEMDRLEAQIGIDLRNDIAATLGGEAAFALDGTMLPVPSWKLIVEVYDAATLRHTLEQAVIQVNLVLAGQDKPAIVFETEEAAGRTYTTLRREGRAGGVVFTTIDGYLLSGPSRAVVDQAIAQRASGVTLTSSSAFRAMLPDNGYADCSALVYRNLDVLVDAVPPGLVEQLALAGAAGESLSAGLMCVFAGPDRITAATTGGSLIGLGSMLGLREEAESAAVEIAGGSHDAVSSRE